MPKYKMQYEEANLGVKFLLVIFLLSAGNYFLWRIFTLNEDVIIFSSILLITEIYSIISGLIHIMMTWRLSKRSSTEPVAGSSVDVFVTTFNESIDLVRRTLSAAVNMEYPHTTWLLDDGNRVEMRNLANSLGARYLARVSTDDAKAGNLNFGLQKSDGEFIALFDADHVPNKNFLTATLGYFKDKKVAFVQTPQDFYNTDSFQHRSNFKKGLVWTEQSLFFQVIQRGKDYWNAAFFCGTSAVMRRSSLNRIGGFATGTVTEDLHTSIRLHKSGYRSVYHAQSLAFGIAPSTIEPFITQRIRWGKGAMQVWKKEGLLFAKGLSFPQRLCYFASVFTYFDGWSKGLLYFIPVITLLTGMIPIKTGFLELLIYLLPYVLLNYILTEELARGYGQSLYIEQYNMARYYAFLIATLSFFVNKKITFEVTKKEGLSLDKKNYLIPQIAVFYLNFLAIPIGAFFFFYFGHLPKEVFLFTLFWALVNIGLSTSIINFSNLKSKSKRFDHRFPVPHAIAIEVESGKKDLLMMTNLSSSGCRISGGLSFLPKLDDLIKFTVYVPGHELFVSAIIKSINFNKLGNTYVLGCSYSQENFDGQQALEKYLYGSDYQWIIHNFSEKSLTPMKRIKSLFSKILIKDTYCEDEWSPIAQADGTIIGIYVPSKSVSNIYRLVLNSPPEKKYLNAKLFSGTEIKKINLQMLTFQKIENPSYPYYLCEYEEVMYA